MRIVQHVASCTGCQACVIACKEQHKLPVKISRCHITFRPAKENQMLGSAYHFKACYQCQNAKCISVCKTEALYKESHTGIVKFDAHKCIACGACMIACPFDAITMNLERNCIEKCDLCSDVTPACVKACPYDLLGVEVKR